MCTHSSVLQTTRRVCQQVHVEPTSPQDPVRGISVLPVHQRTEPVPDHHGSVGGLLRRAVFLLLLLLQDAFKLAVFGSVDGPPEKQKSSGTKRKTEDPEAKVRDQPLFPGFKVGDYPEP